MTYAQIFTKYMIEYDKANVASSYPSLTEYEIATILDKAYLALITQKITGNNIRRASLESDVKAIEDLQNLITRERLLKLPSNIPGLADNEYVYNLPKNLLHCIGGRVDITKENKDSSIDKRAHIQQEAVLMSARVAIMYKASSTNLPWMQWPIFFLENDKLHLLIDSYEYYKNPGTLNMVLSYVRKPLSFVENIKNKDRVTFELNDDVAEELINMALIMSLEITESPRLDSKIKTSQLES